MRFNAKKIALLLVISLPFKLQIAYASECNGNMQKTLDITIEDYVDDIERIENIDDIQVISLKNCFKDGGSEYANAFIQYWDGDFLKSALYCAEIRIDFNSNGIIQSHSLKSSRRGWRCNLDGEWVKAAGRFNGNLIYQDLF